MTVEEAARLVMSFSVKEFTEEAMPIAAEMRTAVVVEEALARMVVCYDDPIDIALNAILFGIMVGRRLPATVGSSTVGTPGTTVQ